MHNQELQIFHSLLMLLELPNQVGSNEKASSFEWEFYEMHTVFWVGKSK